MEQVLNCPSVAVWAPSAASAASQSGHGLLRHSTEDKQPRKACQNSEWSQDMLYDYFFLRDRVGARHLQRHLPEIIESFHEQFFAITEWREDVKEYKAVMDLEPDDEVESSWLRLFTFFNAVTAAEENLHQMLAY